MAPLDVQAGTRGEAPGDVKLVKSAERTIAILELLASAPQPLTTAEIFKQTGYPRSSLHWLLLTLLELNWIEQTPEGAYRIGTHALLCGTAYLDRDPVMEHVSAILEKVGCDHVKTLAQAKAAFCVDDTKDPSAKASLMGGKFSQSTRPELAPKKGLSCDREQASWSCVHWNKA